MSVGDWSYNRSAPARLNFKTQSGGEVMKKKVKKIEKAVVVKKVVKIPLEIAKKKIPLKITIEILARDKAHSVDAEGY